MDTLLSFSAGIALSAACGFRVFVPLLVLSIAAQAGYWELSPSFQWLASDVAFGALLLATVLEIAAYSIPFLDNLLDTIASPIAVMAGVLVMASLAMDVHPFIKWTLAVVAGGGVAAMAQGSTVLLRGFSSMGTFGAANLFLSTLEFLSSLAMAIMAVLIPLVAGGVVIFLLVWVGLKRGKRSFH